MFVWAKLCLTFISVYVRVFEEDVLLFLQLLWLSCAEY